MFVIQKQFYIYSNHMTSQYCSIDTKMLLNLRLTLSFHMPQALFYRNTSLLNPLLWCINYYTEIGMPI